MDIWQLWSFSSSLRLVCLLVQIHCLVCFRLVSAYVALPSLLSRIRTQPFYCLLGAKPYPRSQSWWSESIQLHFGQVASQGQLVLGRDTGPSI